MSRILENSLIIGCFLLLPVSLKGQSGYTDQDLIITGLSGGGDFNNLAISPIDQNMMMCSSLMTGVYITTSGPANWKMINYSQLKAL